MSLDTPFLLDLTVLPLAVFKVDFFATAGSCRIWLDAGRCLSSEVPNTVRAVLDKYPKFVNQLCSKCASENWIEVDQILREVGIDEAENATHDASNDAHRTTRLPPARNLLNPWTARVTFPFEDLILFVDTVPDTCTPPLTNLEC